MVKFALSASVLLAAFATSTAQTLDYLGAPVQKWDHTVSAGLVAGNSVVVSEDGMKVYVTDSKGVLTAINDVDGTEAWAVSPTSSGIMSCESGIVMAGENLIYVVRDDGVDPTSRVVAFDAGGTAVWESVPIVGLNSGDPVVSENGEFIFVTHNSEFNSIGHFSVIKASDGSVFFTESYDTLPLAPPAIYGNPTFGGFYKDGQTNKNDIVMFGAAPVVDDVIPSSGGVFVFQFPENFDGTSTAGLGILQVNTPTWVTKQPPAIGLSGRSAYWGVSRNQFRAWYGDEPDNQALKFDRTARYSFTGLGRGKPAQIPPYTAPTLSSDETNIYWGTADGLIIGFDKELGEVLRIQLDSPAEADVVVSIDDSTLFYAEQVGLVHAARKDGTPLWSQGLDGTVKADMALDSTGSYLYVADGFGTVVKWEVATGATPRPTLSPTAVPSVTPTFPPTMPPVPTFEPSPGKALKTPEPTNPPVEPTLQPVEQEITTEEPTASPSESDETSAASNVVFGAFSLAVGMAFAYIML